jgi:hypothetical protein
MYKTWGRNSWNHIRASNCVHPELPVRSELGRLGHAQYSQCVQLVGWVEDGFGQSLQVVVVQMSGSSVRKYVVSSSTDQWWQLTVTLTSGDS